MGAQQAGPQLRPERGSQEGWVEGGGGGNQVPAGLGIWAPSHLLVRPPAPPQEMWRSSFLHHSNRCSCFHWPGASLMLLAVLLLLGCHGGQPAGRYAAPSQPRLPRGPACPSAASAEPAVPPRTCPGRRVLPLSCPMAGTQAVQGSRLLAARWLSQNETVSRRGWAGDVRSPGPQAG